MDKAFRDLSPLLDPKGIAVVGASPRCGSAGRLVLENLLHLGYRGPIYAVHPWHQEVMGVPCFPDLGALPERVDMVAVLLAADKVLPVLQSAVEGGIRAAWVLASGFAESGPEGQARQTELTRFAAETGLLLCGPNCIGFANLADRVATWSVALSPATNPGNVSMVVQSGAVALGFANLARFGFRYLVSSGNEAGLDSADYIGYFVQDPKTQVILAFLEGIGSPERFVAAAKAAAKVRKPILLVKVGRSEVAQRAVRAHTGSLAGSDAVFDAVCRQLGVIRLETLDELVEAAELFRTSPLPAGNGIGLLSLSGGQIGLVADLAQDLALDFPSLSDGARAELGRVLPAFSAIANPLDAWGSGNLEETYPACVDVVSREAAVHLVAISRDTPPKVASREIEQSLAVAEAAVRVREETGKPVLLFSNVAAGFHPDVKQRLDAGGVPYLQGTREALRAMQAFLSYGAFQRARREKSELPSVRPVDLDVDGWRRRLQEHPGDFSEVETRELLAACGIRGPRELVASTEGEAVAAADQIGYPVVLKVHSPDIQHKTEIGGVRVGLQDEDAVGQAFRQVTAAARSHYPAARLQGVLIQEMVTSAVAEVILGLMQDHDFGPIVVYGSGGVLVELLHDSSLRQPPFDHAEALAMIEETRGAILLRGFRGSPPADVAALADALVRLSWLAADLGDLLAALEINPLMVLPAGQGVVAVDALLEHG